jgi:hypothetical protein
MRQQWINDKKRDFNANKKKRHVVKLRNKNF